MNVLIEFGSGAEDFDDEVYTELFDLLKVDQCVLIHHNKILLPSRKINKYVSQSFYAPPMWNGDYEEAISQVGWGNPLDDELLDKMAPYENEVMAMLLRWSHGEYTDMWHDYCKHIRFWNHVLDLYKIEVFFTTEIIHSGYNYIIYLLCKIKGIAYFSTQRISYPERLHVAVDVKDQLPFFKSEYDEMCTKYAECSCDEITLRDDIQEMYDFYTGGQDRTPVYMKNNNGPKRRKWAIALYAHSTIVRWIFDAYTDKNIVGRRVRELALRLKLILELLVSMFSFSMEINELFSEYSTFTSVFRESSSFLSYYSTKTAEVDYDKKYIYVPLHYQPEQTTSPLGGKYVDQLLMIKMLSYYLPQGWGLYVKEHPTFKNDSSLSRATWRSRKFYDELASIPNVSLVRLEEDTYRLIDNCQAVAVITGTAGLEAITQGKKCLMFGYGYLQYAPNVINIRNNKDCVEAMNTLDNHIDEMDLKKKIKVYFKVLEQYFFTGKILWYDAAYRPNYLKDRDDSKNNIIKAYVKEIKRICGDEVFI